MTNTNKSYICANCNQIINDRYMLRALDKMWHEDCLKCACCDCRLGETGSTLYLKANLILCKRDYLRLFGMTGHCASCQRLIPAFDLVMRCGKLVYHLNCFSCYECQQKFCVGDRYFLYNNQILCEDDHERAKKALLSSSSSSSSSTDSSLFSK